ncbi:MAG: hypothetical protein L0H29_06645 [Sinobacteraceae bacterium]|nr:hypothetical protein [Nevskiaceae bacterium]
MFGGSAVALFAGIVLGAIGVAYLMVAKRRAHIPMLACGAALLVFPLFVRGVWALVVGGAILVALPFVGTRMGWW